jgi:transposase-like protein
MAVLKVRNDGRQKYGWDLKRYIKKYLDPIYSDQKRDYDQIEVNQFIHNTVLNNGNFCLVYNPEKQKFTYFHVSLCRYHPNHAHTQLRQEEIEERRRAGEKHFQIKRVDE